MSQISMKDRILYEPLNQTVPTMSLGAHLFISLEMYSENICQIDVSNDKKEKYKSVKERSVRTAIVLTKKGITPSDVICICSNNTMDNCIPILACLYIGAKVANLEPRLSVETTKHLLSLVEPKIIFVEDSSLEMIEASVETLGFQPELIVFGKSKKYRNFSEFNEKLHKKETVFTPVLVDVNDTAVMFFSSGTTGLPKAICHTHFTFMNVIRNIDWQYNTILHFSTMYWISGMVILVRAIEEGYARTFFSRPISGKDTFSVIQKYKINTIFTAPILTYHLTTVEDYVLYDTSSLKYIMTGGTALNPKQIFAVERLFKNCRVLYNYGLSECGLVTQFPFDVSNESIRDKIEAGTCGKVIPGIALKIVDPNTKAILGPNERGEIYLRSDAVMKGYYHADVDDAFDKNHFLRTGDIGYYDEDQYVYIVARIKEMFKYKSWHIVPSMIEAVLNDHPSVQEAVVFGVPHDEDGHLPAAWVVLKEDYVHDRQVTAEEIVEFVGKRVSDMEKLRGGVTIVKGIPRTPTGKVNRNDVSNIFMKSMQDEPRLEYDY